MGIKTWLLSSQSLESHRDRQVYEQGEKCSRVVADIVLGVTSIYPHL